MQKKKMTKKYLWDEKCFQTKNEKRNASAFA